MNQAVLERTYVPLVDGACARTCACTVVVLQSQLSGSMFSAPHVYGPLCSASGRRYKAEGGSL